MGKREGGREGGTDGRMEEWRERPLLQKVCFEQYSTTMAKTLSSEEARSTENYSCPRLFV